MIHLIPNSIILIKYKVLYHIISLVAKAETVGVFFNTQIALPIRYILKTISNLQLLTPIKTNNPVTIGFANNNIYEKYLKS